MDRMIIERKTGNFDYLEIVLCKIENDQTPFVTYLYNNTDNGYYHGSYHTSLLEAVYDFNDRS